MFTDFKNDYTDSFFLTDGTDLHGKGTQVEYKLHAKAQRSNGAKGHGLKRNYTDYTDFVFLTDYTD